MEARQRLSRFHFNDDAIIDKQIKSVAGLQPQSFIDNRQCDLAADRQATTLKFVREALLVSRFQQAGTKQSVDFQPRIDNLASHGLQPTAVPFVE